jgi:hypothetical protein
LLSGNAALRASAEISISPCSSTERGIAMAMVLQRPSSDRHRRESLPASVDRCAAARRPSNNSK